MNCSSSSKKNKTLSFFRFPSVKDNRGRIDDRAVLRRKLWVMSLRRTDMTESKLKNERVCSQHFISGNFFY